jgi:hypothetical protein
MTDSKGKKLKLGGRGTVQCLGRGWYVQEKNQETDKRDRRDDARGRVGTTFCAGVSMILPAIVLGTPFVLRH